MSITGFNRRRRELEQQSAEQAAVEEVKKPKTEQPAKGKGKAKADAKE